MFDEIELVDWESHKHSLIKMGKVLTVILGKSHKGKSSIVRGIRWAVQNEPVSTKYFPRGNKKPKTSVCITKDDEYITRLRTKSKNQYESSEVDEPFSALRTGVPTQVDDFFGMSDINIQSQGNVHFMLTDTPGKRAKALNSIAGLSEMDEATDKVNKWHRAIETKFNGKTMQLEDLDKQIKALVWVDDAITEFAVLERQEVEIEKLDKSIAEITRIISNIKTINAEIDELPDTSAIVDIDAILDADDDLYDLEVKRDDLQKRIKTYIDSKKAVNDLIVPDDEEFQILDTKNAEIGRLNNKIQNIKRLIGNVRSCKKILMDFDGKLADIVKEEAIFLESFEICPFCEKPMGES